MACHRRGVALRLFSSLPSVLADDLVAVLELMVTEGQRAATGIKPIIVMCPFAGARSSMIIMSRGPISCVAPSLA